MEEGKQALFSSAPYERGDLQLVMGRQLACDLGGLSQP